jgi:hypothetical protein
MTDSENNHSILDQTCLLNKIKEKIFVSVIEIRSQFGYQFAHPSKLNIKIPLSTFDENEIEFLIQNQSKYQHCDVAVDKDYYYPCYELVPDFLLTNEINLNSFR